MKNKRMLIRIIIILLTIFIIISSEIKIKRRIKPFGVLLIDNSKSMSDTKIPEIKTKYKLKIIRFNDNEDRTAIGDAIIEAERRFPNSSFIAIFSDGENNSGINPVDVVKNLKKPVFVLLPSFPEKPQIYVKKTKDFFETGDTAYFYINVSKNGNLFIEENGKIILKKNFIENREFKIPYYSNDDGEKILKFIFEFENMKDSIIEKLNFYKGKKYAIYFSKPDWNVRFIKRLIEEKGFKEDKEGDINFFIMNERDEKIEKKIKDFYKDRKKIFVFTGYPLSMGILPFEKFSIKKDSIEDIHFKTELPFFTFRNAKELVIRNIIMGYFSEDRRLFQTNVIELWKLSFVCKSLLNKDYLDEILDSVIQNMGLKEKKIIVNDTVNAGEEFYIYSEGIMAKKIIIDSICVPYSESLLVFPSKEGYHKIIFEGEETIIKNIYAKNPFEKKGIVNKDLLEEIVNISGGDFINGKIEREFNAIEDEIIIDLRHSFIFYFIILILLTLNWYLWMRRR